MSQYPPNQPPQGPGGDQFVDKNLMYNPQSGPPQWIPPQGQQYPQHPPQSYQQYPQQPYHPQQLPIFTPPQQQSPPKKQQKSLKELWNSGKAGKCGVISVGLILILAMCMCANGINAAMAGSNAATASPTQAAQVASTSAPQPTPTATPRPKPTPKPTPTQSPAQIEAAYKASTTDTNVASLDKDGSADQGTDVHFTCSIVNFVKDGSGVTAAANVTDPSSVSGSFVQVAFTPGTNITRLNAQDILEVWGTDQGASSGTNAFGATIQEVVVQAQYMKDQTTGYRADD